jgi:hypothetical protein
MLQIPTTKHRIDRFTSSTNNQHLFTFFLNINTSRKRRALLMIIGTKLQQQISVTGADKYFMGGFLKKRKEI